MAFVARELAPLGRAAAAKWLDAFYQDNSAVVIGSALQSGGSKLPRHGGLSQALDDNRH